MSRTYRRHDAPGTTAKRGPKNRPDEDAPKLRLKSNKQIRKIERQALRREWR